MYIVQKGYRAWDLVKTQTGWWAVDQMFIEVQTDHGLVLGYIRMIALTHLAALAHGLKLVVELKICKEAR